MDTGKICKENESNRSKSTKKRKVTTHIDAKFEKKLTADRMIYGRTSYDQECLQSYKSQVDEYDIA